MSKRRTKKTNAPKHTAFRLALDVIEIIESTANRTGWPQRKVVEAFIRTAPAAMRGEHATAKALADLLNAAAATQAAKLKAEGLAAVARRTELAATERLRKATGSLSKPPLRQSA